MKCDLFLLSHEFVLIIYFPGHQTFPRFQSLAFRKPIPASMRSDMSSQQSLASSSSSSSGMMADIEGGYRRPRRESEPGIYTNVDHKKQGLLSSWLALKMMLDLTNYLLSPAIMLLKHKALLYVAWTKLSIYPKHSFRFYLLDSNLSSK